jgi:hypothetical protein
VLVAFVSAIPVASAQRVTITEPAAGAQLYVSTTGSDSNPGTSAAPFQTIGKASQVASPGTTVYVAPGTYVGDVHVTAPGVTYKSTVKWGAVIVPAASSSNLTGFWNDRAANVTIDGFLVDGSTNPGQWTAGIYCDATNCTIRNNKVVNIATAPPGSINPSGATGIEIDGYYGDTGGFILNNVVGNVGLPNPGYNLRHCIYLAAYGTTVQNNIIFGCHEGYGIESWHGASQLTISNNLIFHSVRGVQVGSGNITGAMYNGGNDYTMVFNNIVFDGDLTDWRTLGIEEGADSSTGGSIGTHNQYSNNCVSVAGAWNLSVSSHENDANGTPTFVNYQPDGSGDYHLVDGSYCTDQGIPSLGGQFAPAADFDGIARPVGGLYDIGPYERTNTVSVAQMWNPAHSNNRIAIDNVTASATNANYMEVPVFASYGATSGKYYWETVVSGDRASDIGAGIGNASAPVADDDAVGGDTNSVGYYPSGQLWYNGTVQATLASWSSGARICHALDMDSHRYWVRVGSTGKWNNSTIANPAASIGGYGLPAPLYASPVAPAINLYTPSDSATGYFTPQSWAGQPPSGFGAF